MTNRCVCGHHRLTHTYTREANIGPCLGHITVDRVWSPGDAWEFETCDCDEYEEAS